MTAPGRPNAQSPARHSKWRRRLPRILVLLLILAAVFVWWTVLRERDTRRQQSLQSNLILARVVSGFLDQKCETLHAILTDFVRREQASFLALQSIRGAGRDTLERYLRVLSTVIPTPVSLAAYDLSGRRVASYPATDIARPRMGEDEIRNIIKEIDDSTGRVSYQCTAKGIDAFLLTVALWDGAQVRGVLIASYQAHVLADWLEPLLASSDRTVYILDASGRPVIVSGGRKPSGNSFADYEPVQLALTKTFGAIEAPLPDSKERALIGYALATVPRWAVVVAQSTHQTLAPFDILANSTALVVILGLLVAGGVWLLPLFQSEPRMTAGGLQKPGVRPVRSRRPDSWPRIDQDGSSDRFPKNQPVGSALNGHVAPIREDAEKHKEATPERAVRASSTAAYYVQEGAWKVVAASVTGKSHVRSGQQCQDASYCKVLNKSLLVGAVADGAGSAPLGDQGAQVAARFAVETLAAHAGELEPSADDQQWNRLLMAVMQVARGHIEVNAAIRDEPARHLATTLIVYAAMPDLLVGAQIGDGAIVFRDGRGTIRSLTSPKSGEYINTTTFLVSPNAFKSVQQTVWRGPYTDIAVFTDGLQMLALTMPQGVPHPRFFEPLFDFAANTTDRENALEQLNAFLQSEKTTNRTDDDLTLMLATIAP